jgi:Na+/melibiose symporter-like transporter
MISFVQKAGISLGLLVNGYCLKWIGYVEGAKQQSAEVSRNLLLIGFIGGTIVGLAAMFCIAWYPVTREHMEKIKAELAEKDKLDQQTAT